MLRKSALLSGRRVDNSSRASRWCPALSHHRPRAGGGAQPPPSARPSSEPPQGGGAPATSTPNRARLALNPGARGSGRGRGGYTNRLPAAEAPGAGAMLRSTFSSAETAKRRLLGEGLLWRGNAAQELCFGYIPVFLNQQKCQSPGEGLQGSLHKEEVAPPGQI